MKKFLLSISAIAAASAAFAFGTPSARLVNSDKFEAGPLAPDVKKAPATRASGAVDFTYAGELYTAYTLGDMIPAGSRVYLLIGMTPEEIKAYAGNKVTSFSVYSPTDYNGRKNPITDGTFFYSTDLKGADYSQDFEFSSSPMSLTEVSMETPYTITGEEKSLYFGYSFTVKNTGDSFYIPVDGQPNSNRGSLIYGVSTSEAFPADFDMTAGGQIGALCMSVKIEGEDLPENMASITNFYTPPYFPLTGEGANVEFIVRNIAANDLSSVEVTASVTGMPDLVQTFDFDPMPFGGMATLAFNGVKANEEAFVDFSLNITKVNGVAFDGNKVTSSVPAYDSGFEKKIVAEDATGTWCGWCPGGIEALEYLKTTYPEKAIAIGVHNGDEMEIESYMDFIGEYVSGFPTVLYNRMVEQTPTSPYTQVCQFIDQVAAYFDYPSYAQVSLEGKTSEDGSKAAVTASAEFKVATTVPHYLSFVIVEDGVGPYYQTNYFKQQRVVMNGWEKKASKVSILFNDVARYYDCFPGIEDSLPAKIEANSVNTYSIELPLSNVAGNDYRVVALLTNAETGEIVNACQYSMSKDTGTAVEGIATPETAAEYYDLTGRRIDNPTKGIYIKKSGDNTQKVIL